MDCHRATGPQHHLQLGNLLQPQSFSPPPHLPQPFTTSPCHHIFMKLCTGGVCVCEGWVVVVVSVVMGGLTSRVTLRGGCSSGAAAGRVQLVTGVGGGWGGESAGGCHIRNCLILPSAA